MVTLAAAGETPAAGARRSARLPSRVSFGCYGVMSDDLPDLEPIALEPIAPPAWPAGWYADPWTAGQYRYWNGVAWTSDIHRSGPATPPMGSQVTAGSPATMLPTYPQARNPAGPRVAAVVAGLVVLVLLAGAIGYAIEASTENNSSNGTRPPATLAPGPTVPAVGAADRAALSKLVVQQSDVGAARVVLLIPNGNRTTEPTLDLCNGTFATEKLRVARLQVAEVGSTGAALLSTEAVTYRNAAATVSAFAELRKVRRACPHDPVTSPVGGGTAETAFKAAPDRAWPRTPSVERLAYSFTTTSGGTTSPSIAVYLRRGRVLMGVYFPKPAGSQPAVAGKTSVADIVGLFEARMARLPAKVVGSA
jgi:hypothetical protein